MSFPIYEPVTKITVFIRYQKYDVLAETYSDVDDCFSSTIEMFREYLKKYPGLAGAVGYGKNIRPDLLSKIILEYTDAVGHGAVEFKTAKAFIEFVKERPAIAKALEYTP
jgi:hypothetical protein